MAEYRLSPEAQRDLDKVFDYTVAKWGLTQALHYTDAIEASCAELAENPDRAPRCDAIRPGYRRSRIEHHIVYFKTADYGIAVIRILHERMDATRHL